jgi:hypothetical protein
MAKNGNGEGSIYPYKKNGKKVGYRGAYVVHTAEGPKRRYVSGKNRDEARRKLTEAMANRDKGLIYNDENLTLPRYGQRSRRGDEGGARLKDVMLAEDDNVRTLGSNCVFGVPMRFTQVGDAGFEPATSSL